MSDTTPGHDEARFTGESFRGAVLRDCDVSGMRIVDSKLTDLYVSGYDGPIVVNDVDVTAYVEAELDRLQPARVQARAVRSGSADDLRAMWEVVQALWATTIESARRLPEAHWYEHVHGEWSLVETLRHLVFATDAWVRRAVLDEAEPFHPFGYPATGYPEESSERLGLAVAIDPSFQPSVDEILAVRADRIAGVSAVVAALADVDLDRSCERPPAPGYPSPHTVRQCLGVVMNEEVEHHRYAVRDLAVAAAD